jgi:hypothetical protein
MDREPVPREIASNSGSAEESVDGIKAGSPLTASGSAQAEVIGGKQMCPYLRSGDSWTSCEAYMGPYTEPSVYEQENYCSTCSHSSCVWFASKGKEVIKEVIKDRHLAHMAVFDGADGIEKALAHSRP